MKKTYINKRGEVVELDLADNAPLPDGYGIRVASYLIDGVPQDASRSYLADQHRPGYRLANDAAARSEHARMVARQSAAWRGTIITDNDLLPGPYVESHADKPADFTLPSSPAREKYIRELSNAWKTGKALADRPAYEAWPQGGWRDKNPSPRPADVQLDAAPPDSAAAWRALVARTENAWRS